MNKKLFSILVILMSLSLIGIIFVQAYYINYSLETKEDQFAFNVKKVLSYASNQVTDIEYNKYVTVLNAMIARGQEPDTSAIRSIRVYKQNKNINQIVVYDTGVKEENYTIPNTQNNGTDSVNFKKLKGKTVQETYTTGIDGQNMPNLEYSLTKVLNMDRLQKATFEAQYKAEIQNTPIEERVSNQMIERLLDNKLKENNIDTAYEYAILKNNDPTSVQSKSFEASLFPTIGVPIFLDENGESEYGLYINFPRRKRFIMSSIIGMTSLSILFTVIIIIAYTSALYQLIQQRKISQMKSDFINNMTHEFKTPIATINLALDAIKNPKIFQHADKVTR